MATPALLLPLLLLLPVLVLGADYCSVCKDHTMCTLSEGSIGSKCTEYRSSAISRADINLIVHRHNLLRNRVARGLENNKPQPSASNMRKMIWSVELAQIAQRWANQCDFRHDTCRNAADGTYVGQNIYWEATTGNRNAPNWTKAVQSWYDEVKQRDGSLNVVGFKAQGAGEPMVGHYTQLAWASTYKVGCGYADYRKDSQWLARIMVCNYSPGGNFLRQKMYESGAAASRCPSGTKKDSYYTGLCARV